MTKTVQLSCLVLVLKVLNKVCYTKKKYHQRPPIITILSFCEKFSAFIADKGLRSFGTRHNYNQVLLHFVLTYKKKKKLTNRTNII